MKIRQLIPILLTGLLFSFVSAQVDIVFRKNVKPIRYTLTVETNLEVSENCSTFNGSVSIELYTSKAASNITLHARALYINNNTIRLVHSSGSKVNVIGTETDEEREFYIIHLEDELLVNEYYNLTIEEYSGIMRYDKVGFYLAKYTTKDGDERNIAATDFQPTDARKAFPCFDDPSMKAKFIINIIRPGKYFALSNEDLTSTENLGDGRYMDTFKETMILPTYAVAFMVLDYKSTQKVERHRVFAKPDAIDDGLLDYALTTGVEVLKSLEEYTGLNYTNTKMDQVTIPAIYYQDEAMENWGLVTYSEKHLFVSNTSTFKDIESSTLFIAHEFSHQWFGNLVTFKEWKYMWLNEGFANFFQHYIASLVRPSWRLMDRFVITTLQNLLEFDSTNITESISNCRFSDMDPLVTLSICYASLIIRMTQHFLTFDIFRRALHLYLENNKFKNTEPQDLYLAYQAIIDEENAHDLLGNNNVSSIIETWNSNKGFPLLTVQRNYDNKTITLSQRRYIETGEIENDPVWYIPISYVYQFSTNTNFSDTKAGIWLTQKTMTIIDQYTDNGWFLVNKQQGGYYRVNYDLANWDRLALFLSKDNYKFIHVLNRAQLIDDAFHLAHHGEIPYHVPLNLSKYLVREVDYIPIAPFVKALPHLMVVMSSSKLYYVYKNYVVNLLSTAYEHLGFNEKSSDTHLDKFNRIIVIWWLCKLGHMKCRNDALKNLHKWRETGILPVSDKLKYAVLCHSLRIANADDWEFVYEKAINDSKTTYNIYFSALACSENEFILKDYLNRLFNNTLLLNTWSLRAIFLDVTTNSDVGLRVAMHFLGQADIPEKIQSAAVSYVSAKFTTTKQLEEMQALNSTLPKETLTMAVDKILRNIQFAKDSYKEDMEKWFREYDAINGDSSNIV